MQIMDNLRETNMQIHLSPCRNISTNRYLPGLSIFPAKVMWWTEQKDS